MTLRQSWGSAVTLWRGSCGCLDGAVAGAAPPCTGSGPAGRIAGRIPGDAAGGAADGTAPCACAGRSRRSRAWAELLRLPALFSVPGDALAGAAATGSAPGSRTLLAIGSSLCLYEAGMALNDWADRDVDAVERPHRPLPSGRVRPAAALTAACALTGAGLALAARAGRPALAVAAPLAVTVWAYDLGLKHTPAGPLAMGAARGLDLLLGAAATTGHARPALPSAALLGTHTLAVTTVSRQEAQGGSSLAPLAALATTALLTRQVMRRSALPTRGRRQETAHGLTGPRAASHLGLESGAEGRGLRAARPVGLESVVGLTGLRAARPLGLESVVGLTRLRAARSLGLESAAGRRGPRAARPLGQGLLTTVLGAAYAATAARPYFHAALNPSPPLTQRAVGAGIRATIPLQATLAARSRDTAAALLIAALAPLGARFAKKVSVT